MRMRPAALLLLLLAVVIARVGGQVPAPSPVLGSAEAERGGSNTASCILVGDEVVGGEILASPEARQCQWLLGLPGANTTLVLESRLHSADAYVVVYGASHYDTLTHAM